MGENRGQLNSMARNGHSSPQFQPLEIRARCGGPCALTAQHGLKLLSNLEVQLCDTFVEFALAAILGADRQIKVFLGVAKSRYQLGLGIDHQPSPSGHAWQRQHDGPRGFGRAKWMQARTPGTLPAGNSWRSSAELQSGSFIRSARYVSVAASVSTRLPSTATWTSRPLQATPSK